MKRIITCSDGTWNKPNSEYRGKPVRTNVQKIFDYILKQDAAGVTQIKHYDEGIGAAGNWITHLVDGATGKGIDQNIIDAYKFIIWNYEPGDEIYLFGFSRGAYTARSIAGLIRKSGIIRRNNLNLIADAYDLYRDKAVGPDTTEAKQFRSDNSYEVSKIKCIGVWDTVGALGIPLSFFQWYNKLKYSFYDTTLSSIVENAFHALAVDERRSNFRPTLWERSVNATKRNFTQVLEQRWFAGVHANVGGGYPDEELSDLALQWMIEKVSATGLAFDGAMQSDLHPSEAGTLYNSKDGIFAWLPSYIRPISKSEESIDSSVYERIRNVPGYRPKNVPTRD